MQTKKKALTTLIAAILMLSMVFAAIPMASASPIDIYIWDEDEEAPKTSGNVGDTIVVNGTVGATYAGSLVDVYWNERKPWDEETHTGWIADDYAGGADPYEYKVEIDVPEIEAGVYGVIAVIHDAPTETAREDFTVLPELMLDPDAGIAEDRIEVDGTGFGADERDLDVYFDWHPPYWDMVGVPNSTELSSDELTDAVSINTDEFGSFTAPDRFDVPEGEDPNPVDEDHGRYGNGTYHVIGIDEDDNYGYDIFTVGFYIKLDPKEGPPGITITIEGKMTENSEVDVEFGIWTDGPWPSGDWSPGTRRTVLEDVDTDADGYFEAEFEVPDVEAETYLVVATDGEDEKASREFKVLAEPTITLIPDSGMPGDEIEVEGDYFTEDSDITLTFDGIDVTPAGGIETYSDGSFAEEFIVPDVTFGDYEVTAEDEEGLTATDDFEVREFVLIVRPRAGPYYRGAAISFEVKSTEDLQKIKIDIYDPTGYPFYKIDWVGPAGNHPTPATDADVVFEEDPDFYYVPWYNQIELTGAPLPDDAPLGTWTYEGELEYYDESAERWKDYDIDGTFTVVELPYETMGASLAGIEDDVDTIKADLGTVAGDVSDVAGDVTGVAGDVTAVAGDVAGVKSDVAGVKSDVAAVKSDVAAVKSDVAAVKDQFPIEVPLPDLTPMWVAAILSLIAAIAAIAAVVQISRKLA